MKPQSCKAKGRNLQKLVRDKLLAAYPELEPDDIRSTPMGVNGPDLQLSPAARRAIPFDIECKARKAIAVIYDALEQAHDPTTSSTALAVVKADRKQPLVVLPLDDFITILVSRG